MTTTTTRQFILIAGPYRSGTGDDPVAMAQNLARLEAASWPIFERGHVPVIGEWFALPIWRTAGGRAVGDHLYETIFHPVAGRLIERCDAILRLPGASKGADEDVRKARARGLPIYLSIDEVPVVTHPS